VKKCPNPLPGAESEIEIREVFELADFAPAYTLEGERIEERVAARMAANANGHR
jgi:hypothetical protein